MRPNIDRSFEKMAMPHLNALFQTALRLKQNRREAEVTIEGIYTEAWKAFNRGLEYADWRLELFRILCRHVDNIDELPLLLIDCHDFTYSQAAEILGVSIETLKDRLRQGRDHMVAQIGDALPAQRSSRTVQPQCHSHSS